MKEICYSEEKHTDPKRARDVDEAKRTRTLARARARILRNRIETIISGLVKRGLLECRSFQRIMISREYTRHYRYLGLMNIAWKPFELHAVFNVRERPIRQISILENGQLSSLERYAYERFLSRPDESVDENNLIEFLRYFATLLNLL